MLLFIYFIYSLNELFTQINLIGIQIKIRGIIFRLLFIFGLNFGGEITGLNARTNLFDILLHNLNAI